MERLEGKTILAIDDSQNIEAYYVSKGEYNKISLGLVENPTEIADTLKRYQILYDPIDRHYNNLKLKHEQKTYHWEATTPEERELFELGFEKTSGMTRLEKLQFMIAQLRKSGVKRKRLASECNSDEKELFSLCIQLGNHKQALKRNGFLVDETPESPPPHQERPYKFLPPELYYSTKTSLNQMNWFINTKKGRNHVLNGGRITAGSEHKDLLRRVLELIPGNEQRCSEDELTMYEECRYFRDTISDFYDKKKPLPKIATDPESVTEEIQNMALKYKLPDVQVGPIMAPSPSKAPAPSPSPSKAPAPSPSPSKAPAPSPSPSKAPAPSPSPSSGNNSPVLNIQQCEYKCLSCKTTLRDKKLPYCYACQQHMVYQPEPENTAPVVVNPMKKCSKCGQDYFGPMCEQCDSCPFCGQPHPAGACIQ